MTAADCLELLQEALERFGTRAYYEQGPHEVLDVPALDAALEALEPAAVGAFLNEVFEHPHGHVLSVALLVGQELRADFDAIVASCSDELVAEWQPDSEGGEGGVRVTAVNGSSFAKSLNSKTGLQSGLKAEQLPEELRQVFGFLG